MTTSEPTTGEIVRALRCDGCDETCSECFFGYEEKDSIGYETWGCRRNDLDGLAADRLESQKWEIERLQGEMFANALESAERIATLTARAEQAERERDAAVKDIEWAIFDAGLCNLCLNRRGDDCAANKCKPKWRGLPQDGEGK